MTRCAWVFGHMGYAHVALERLGTIALRVTGAAGERDWGYRYMSLTVRTELGVRHELLRAFRRCAREMVLGRQMLNKCSVILETLLAYYTLLCCYMLLCDVLTGEDTQYGK